MERDRLIAEVGTLAEGDAFRANDGGRIMRAVAGRAVEDERGLAAVEGDERLSHQRGPRRLSGGARGRGVNGTRAAPDDACEKIEPMDAEIPENEIVEGLEGRSGNPTVIPADLDMDARHLADQAR